MYDLIICGAGPAGLALAQYAAAANKRVLIVEKQKEIGGCHRVHRMKYLDEMLFSEHGPRVISSAYVNFKMLLEKMGTNFRELFVPYNFNFTTVGGTSISKLSFSEIASFTMDFFKLTINKNHGRDITVASFMKSNKFSIKSQEYIDAVCRLTDGANSNTYTLFQFLSLVNQQAFYNLYQPKTPNDIGLFKVWEKHLLSTGCVEFKLGTEITSIENSFDKIVSLNSGSLVAKDYILAIPPKALVKLLDASNNPFVRNAFGLEDIVNMYAKQTEYIPYISIVYHWNQSVIIPKVWGFPKNDWGVGYIILSDYMRFKESSSKTVISAVITKTNAKSSTTGKSAEESTEEEKIDECKRQLGITLPPQTIAFVNPLDDSAFVENINAKNFTIPFRSGVISNLFTLGTHNKMTRYHFTSMESAVTNAIILGQQLYPEIQSNFEVRSPNELSGLIKIIYFIILIIVFKKYSIV